MSKRVKATVALATFGLLSLAMPSPARAVNIYYWYTPYGSTDLVQTVTAPPNGSFVTSTPGPDYLATHVLSEGGFGDIDAPAAGDYCNAYGLPPLNRPGTDPLGDRTGVGMPSPVSSYQRQTSVATSGYNSGCQAANVPFGNTWIAARGWHVNADDAGNNCSFTCGVQQYASLTGTADYPWSGAWYNGQLTLRSDFEMHRYITTTSYAGAWGYTCAILQDVTSQNEQYDRFLEYCLSKWESSPRGNKIVCQGITRSNGKGALVELIIANLDSSPYVENVGTPTVHYGETGALGTRHTFEGTIGTGDLLRAVNDSRTTCGVAFSTNPPDYRLAGIEDGIEGWTGMEKLDGNDTLLQAWTAY